MKDKLKLIISMLIFGSIGIFVKSIKLSSIEIAFLRSAIGSLFLAFTGIFMRKKIDFKITRKNIIILILSGLAIGLNWVFLFQAYKYTTIAKATLSYYFAPVFVIAASPVVLKEKLTLRKVICIVAATLGLFLILNVHNNNMDNNFNQIRGVLYGLLGAVLYASVILINKLIKRLSGFETTLIQLAVASVVLLPIMLSEGKSNIAVIGYGTWILIFVVGIIHTGIAYLLYFSSIQQINGQSVAALSYIDPISAVLFATIFLGESLSILQVIGAILILSSTFFSEKNKGQYT